MSVKRPSTPITRSVSSITGALTTSTILSSPPPRLASAMVLDDQRITGERGHVFALRPSLAARRRVLAHIVDADRASLACDRADPELSHGYADKCVIALRADTGARLKLQYVLSAVQR